MTADPRYHTVTAHNLWEINAIGLEVTDPTRPYGLEPDVRYLDISRDGALRLIAQLEGAVRGYDELDVRCENRDAMTREYEAALAVFEKPADA